MPQVDKGLFILVVQSSLHLFFLTYGILFLCFIYPYFKNIIIYYKIFIKFFFDLFVISYYIKRNTRYMEIFWYIFKKY